MKVPPEMLRKTTSTSLFESEISIPTMMPTGAVREKIPRNRKIAPSEYPVLANAPPSDITAAPLWINIPAAS
jgi:hypothetical protein